jgi:hypothetical protein
VADDHDQRQAKWADFDKAVFGLFEALALLFALPFGEKLYRGAPITLSDTIYLGVGLVFAAAGPFVSRASKIMHPQLKLAARNVYVWLAVILLIFLYGAYQGITGPGSYAAQEARLATLSGRLQQGQREVSEANRSVVVAEAQKATLIDWLQTAQHERDNARQERDQLRKNLEAQQSSPTFQTYSLPARPTAAQECVTLAQRLADLGPAWASEKAQIEHIRSTMTALGCGCGDSKK